LDDVTFFGRAIPLTVEGAILFEDALKTDGVRACPSIRAAQHIWARKIAGRPAAIVRDESRRATKAPYKYTLVLLILFRQWL
jgi:hypothetical protein